MPEKPLKICLVSSELTPLAKTGGLADVSAALSAFLDNKGHDIRVLIPFFSAIDTKSLEIAPDPSLQNLSIRIGNHHLNYSIDTTTLPNTALMQELELDSSDDIPLLGIVSRLTSQKGIDLIQQVVPKLIQQRRFALAVLGSGEPRYEKFFGELKGRYRNHVCFYRGFSNKLAHMIEAGSDMFLMPSQFEPCGLNQMYSLRYGTVPIVRRTGGLADSVQLFEPSSGKGTGIVFDDYSASALEWALNAALDLYQDKKSWRKLVRNGMAMDYSWKHQGQIYIDLFRQILPTGK
jgi:ADP-glucose type glycogen/starch synthase